QAGIQVLAAGVADIAALRRRPALSVHEAADGGRLGAPARRARAEEVARVGQPDGAVERHPAHRLRLRVMPGGGADLPDAGVGITPVLTDEVGDAREVPAGADVEGVALAGIHEGRVEQLAVRVELQLTGRAVADPHPPRAAIAPDCANTSSFSASAARKTGARQGPA